MYHHHHSDAHLIDTKVQLFKGQIRQRHIDSIKHNARNSTIQHFVINHQDEEGTILRLRHLLLFHYSHSDETSMGTRYIETIASMMDGYQFCVQIANHKLIECLLITISSCSQSSQIP